MQHTLVLQLDMFEREESEFSKDAAQWAKKQLLVHRKMTPAMWWRMYGRHVSGLTDIACHSQLHPPTVSVASPSLEQSRGKTYASCVHLKWCER